MRETARAARSGTSFGPAGHVASVIGALGGAAGLAAAGVGLGFAYERRFMPDAGLEWFLPVAVGLVAGAAVGAGVGSWAGVAAVRQPHPALTGALTAVIVPAIPLLLYRLADSLEVTWLLAAFWLGAIALASVFARAITAPVARGALREERVAAVLWLISIVEIFLVIRALVFR